MSKQAAKVKSFILGSTKHVIAYHHEHHGPTEQKMFQASLIITNRPTDSSSTSFLPHVKKQQMRLGRCTAQASKDASTYLPSHVYPITSPLHPFPQRQHSQQWHLPQLSISPLLPKRRSPAYPTSARQSASRASQRTSHQARCSCTVGQ